MRRIRIGLGIFLTIILIGFSAHAGFKEHGGFAEGQILVKFRPDTPPSMIGMINRAHGTELEDVIPGINVYVLRIPPGMAVSEMMRRYNAEVSVEYAEPNYIAYAILDVNDPYLGLQWGMKKVEAPLAWDVSRSGSDIRIAILDTGIDQNHQDIIGKIVANRNFTLSRTVDDLYGHGTHVAGIAAASTNNWIGVAGLGFLASLMNGKVLGDTGSGYYSWLASGIIWATNGPDGIAPGAPGDTNDGAKVINMSLGGTSYSLTLEDAVNYAWGNGAVMTAAAGNSDTDLPFYPAYYINVIAVAATDENDNRASFSNFGGWVDVSAPGVNIYSTMPNHRNRLKLLNYGYLSGTSMSSPHVAGLAALVWKTLYGTDNSSVRGRIEATVDSIITDEYIGKGRINAARAVGAK